MVAFRVTALAIVACASAVALAAQSPASPRVAASQDVPRYRLRVLGIYDEASGSPVEGVEVRDVLSGTSALTTSTGTLSLFFVPDGGSMVRVRKLGYEMQTFMVAISPADTTPLTILLRKAVLLPAVDIRDSAPKYLSPNLTSAEDRLRRHMGGYFIDEAEMRKHDNSSLASTLLSRVPAIMSTSGPHGETYIVSSRQPCKGLGGCKSPNCFIGVMLDGVPVSTPGQTDFQRLLPSDYALAEFYPGGASMPAELGLASPCGVLFLWSRER
ncbi:MAG: hypothetical protein ACREPM_05875 [Gemmatimonadaceae bacterium]